MRHPLHSICPYFAMFPESFVSTQLYAYSRPGDIVFDPFSGRGTTVFESLLSERLAAGIDINPVAACISGAKAHVPDQQAIFDRIEELENSFSGVSQASEFDDEFFNLCFHRDTLCQILHLRSALRWLDDPVDRFIAALMLGSLHGESHRSEAYLSNRMPRTISTKPGYSVRWWTTHNLVAPRRDAFQVLKQMARFRLSVAPPKLKGEVAHGDARNSSISFPHLEKRVSLIVTSPPYIDTTDYAEDQWLRLWFLGGNAKPQARLHRDDRHTIVSDYWNFLEEVWSGCERLLSDESVIVIRIGGMKQSKEDLYEGLLKGLAKSMAGRNVKPLHSGASSSIERRQTNSFRPGTSAKREEHDFTFKLS